MRYYGESVPYTHTSLDNLQYLTIEQTLADYAYFVEFITTKELSY